MLYLRICFDKQGGSELRDELLKAHREYIGSHVGAKKNGVAVVQGGPMCAGDDVSSKLGSFLVVEADSHKDAQRFNDEDPFTRAGLFDNARVVRWDRHIGNPDQTSYVP
ncbi:MAG: YciI family protein [Variovorax sp.]